MAFALQGKKRGSSYNFKNDMQMVLGWIEKLRSPYSNELEVSEAGEGEIYIAGYVDLDQVNRMRRMAGMTELAPTARQDPSKLELL